MNITVYLSSKTEINPDYSDAVVELGEGIGRMGARLVYGGSNAGQMHLLATTAKAAGATVTGVIPEVFRPLADPVADEMIYTLDLSERKSKLISMGNVYVALPGGIGTLDEIAGTLAELTVRRITDKRIILVNVNGLFDPLLAQLRLFVEQRLAGAQNVAQVIAVDSAKECLELIENLKTTKL